MSEKGYAHEVRISGVGCRLSQSVVEKLEHAKRVQAHIMLEAVTGRESDFLREYRWSQMSRLQKALARLRGLFR